MSHIPYYNQPEGTKKMKNGFELRTELMAMAKDYVEKQYAANVEYVKKTSELLSAEELVALMKPYSFDDVLSYARQMYSFVNTKE